MSDTAERLRARAAQRDETPPFRNYRAIVYRKTDNGTETIEPSTLAQSMSDAAAHFERTYPSDNGHDLRQVFVTG